jgi:hypothetical protein
MPRDVWEYFEQKQTEYTKLGLRLEGEFRALEGSNDQRGMILGVLHLSERARVHVHEIVLADPHRIRRLRYSYFLVVDGHGEILGYERDPTHEPAEHRHLSDHTNEAWPRVTFREAIEDFWNVLSTMHEDDAPEE